MDREREYWGYDKGNNLKLMKIPISIHNYRYKILSSSFYFAAKVYSLAASIFVKVLNITI